MSFKQKKLSKLLLLLFLFVIIISFLFYYGYKDNNQIIDNSETSLINNELKNNNITKKETKSNFLLFIFAIVFFIVAVIIIVLIVKKIKKKHLEDNELDNKDDNKKHFEDNEEHFKDNELDNKDDNKKHLEEENEKKHLEDKEHFKDNELDNKDDNLKDEEQSHFFKLYEKKKKKKKKKDEEEKKEEEEFPNEVSYEYCFSLVYEDGKSLDIKTYANNFYNYFKKIFEDRKNYLDKEAPIIKGSKKTDYKVNRKISELLESFKENCESGNFKDSFCYLVIEYSEKVIDIVYKKENFEEISKIFLEANFANCLEFLPEIRIIIDENGDNVINYICSRTYNIEDKEDAKDSKKDFFEIDNFSKTGIDGDLHGGFEGKYDSINNVELIKEITGDENKKINIYQYGKHFLLKIKKKFNDEEEPKIFVAGSYCLDCLFIHYSIASFIEKFLKIVNTKAKNKFIEKLLNEIEEQHENLMNKIEAISKIKEKKFPEKIK